MTEQNGPGAGPDRGTGTASADSASADSAAAAESGENGLDNGSQHEPDDSAMSLTDLAPGAAQSGFDRALQWIPRLLASKPHVIGLTLLGVYLVLLPLFGVSVSAKSELIGGNYTNVTSDIGACIAAGGTLHLISQSRKRQKTEAERLRLMREVHVLLHRVHPEIAEELGHGVTPPPPVEPGAK